MHIKDHYAEFVMFFAFRFSVLKAYTFYKLMQAFCTTFLTFFASRRSVLKKVSIAAA